MNGAGPGFTGIYLGSNACMGRGRSINGNVGLGVGARNGSCGRERVLDGNGAGNERYGFMRSVFGICLILFDIV